MAVLTFQLFWLGYRSVLISGSWVDADLTDFLQAHHYPLLWNKLLVWWIQPPLVRQTCLHLHQLRRFHSLSHKLPIFQLQLFLSKQNLYLSATFQSKQPARQQLVEVMLQLQIQVLCNMDFKYLNFDSALNPLPMLTHVHVHVNLKKNSFVV